MAELTLARSFCLSVRKGMGEFQEQLKKAALEYLDRGFSIIPVKQDKTPTLISWIEYQKRKPTKEEIEKWFQNPNVAGIGIITGEISGIVVIDVESTNALIDFQIDFQKKYKMPVPTTPIAKTGGGGWHLYFQYPQGLEVGNSIRFGKELDFKGTGGYIIAPPSLHRSGNFYAWNKDLNTPLAELPKEFFEEIIGNKQIAKADLKQKIKGVSLGQRDNSAVSVAGKLLHNFKSDDWESCCWPLLVGWNKQNQPPLTEPELRKCFDSIVKTELERLSSNGSGKFSEEWQRVKGSELSSLEIPETEFLIEGLLPKAGINMLAGNPSSGKSWVLLEIAKVVSEGEELFGKFKTMKSKVLVIDEESQLSEIKRRWRLLNAKSPDVEFMSLQGFKIDSPDQKQALLELCEAENFKLIIIDSLRDIHLKNENDSQEAQFLMDCFKEFTKRGITLVISHHNRKDFPLASQEEMQSVRGSTAITAGLDSLILVEKIKDIGEKLELIIKPNKLRGGKKLSGFRLDLVEEARGMKWEYLGEVEDEANKTQKTKDAILKLLEGGEKFRREIVDSLTTLYFKQRTIDRAINELEGERKIKPRKGEKARIYYSLA